MPAAAPLPLLPAVHRELDELDQVELIAVRRLIARLRMARSLDRLNEMADARDPVVTEAEATAIITEVRQQRRQQG